MADLPYCSSYATTTPMVLTYFNFATSFDLDNDESIILGTEVMSSQTGIRAHMSSVDPSTIIGSNWCYSNTNVISACTPFQLPYFELNNDSIDAPQFQVGNFSNFKTRFTQVTVTGTTTAPKDAIVDVTYYLDPTEINTAIPAKNPTLIKLSWANRTNNTFQSLGFNIPTTTGTGTLRMRIPDADLADTGTFDLLVQFSNIGCSLGLSDCPFPDSYVYTSFSTVSKVAGSQGSTENYNTANLVPETEECSLTNFGACITNSLAYLFVPSETSVEQFKSLNTSLSEKFPFAYAYDFANTINTLYTTTANQSATLTLPFGTFGNITLISSAQLSAVPFASFIKTLLSYVLWIMFAVAMYRRTLTIFNPSPV